MRCIDNDRILACPGHSEGRPAVVLPLPDTKRRWTKLFYLLRAPEEHFQVLREDLRWQWCCFIKIKLSAHLSGDVLTPRLKAPFKHGRLTEVSLQGLVGQHP